MKGIENIERVYFVGIGGIGMSAVARYFNASGKAVAGYDRVSTKLTDQLSREGISVHFTDDPGMIPPEFKNPEGTLVIFTPAVPASHKELNYFREEGFEVIKRSAALGQIIREQKGIAVAGSHGKTTVSGMIAYILTHSEIKGSAFLGGISKNLNSNLLLEAGADYIVVEADEFDRSFLQLFPEIAVVTSIDPDHLDIYGNYENLLSSFREFAGQVKDGGYLVHKKGLPLEPKENVRRYTYALAEEADFHAGRIRRNGFSYSFDIHTPSGVIRDFELGIYGKVNLENAVAAFAASYLAGIDPQAIRKGLAGYSGIQRRFDVKIEEPGLVFIDDYAHHPRELSAFILSVREALPGKRISGIFQPHLYTRTRDFAADFAASLSLLDDVIILDIYPAREEPVEGVSAGLIYEKLTNSREKIMCQKEQIFRVIGELKPEVLLTMGAGDIDQIVEPLKDMLSKSI